MATSQGGSQEGSEVSAEDRARIAKAARQLASYANFLRWTANFRRDEILKHPSHDRVMMLSPMQSGRFSFAIEGDTLLLGVQSFESAWMQSMPFDCAYVSDRLYLTVEGVPCMNAKMPPLSLGIFIDESKKRSDMSSCKFVQPTRVTVTEGRVTDVGRALGLGFPVKKGDVIKQLLVAEQAKLRQQDIGRFF